MNNFKWLLLLTLTVPSVVLSQIKHKNNILKKSAYTIKIFPVAEGSFGYDIYNSNKLFIHQPSVPALPGNNGFATKAAAETVARKVVEKIKKGESPPTITVDEMKQWGAIPNQKHTLQNQN